MLANFVKREALDANRFHDTSRALIADSTIRNQLAQTLSDQLYANVDVSAALQKRLPSNLQGLAGPIAGAAREAVDRSAQRLLEQPRVQSVFVNVSTAAERQLVAVLDGNTKVLKSSHGNVVLDVRPLVLDLGSRFSFVSNLQSRIPPGAAQVTVLRSNQLHTAQEATKALRFVANWVWVLVLAAWAAAVWLARGRRRIEVRAIAIGVLVSGLLILVVQRLAGRYLVDHLVKTDSVRPAVSDAYSIITDLLRGAGWTAIIIAVVALVGIWLTGPRPRAAAARHALAPYLRRPELAYGVVVVLYLLVLWWRPTPQFGFLIDVVLFLVFALLGLEVLRRQTAAEFPNAEGSEMTESVRDALARARSHRASRGSTGELERLAKLHADGALDDAEFARAKAQVLGGGSR